MSKIYGEEKNWNGKNYKQSFANLANDGYDFEKIESANWLVLDTWKLAVLCRTYAKKIVKESEKAICFNIVTQYGNEYEMWFPKSSLIK